MGAGCSVDRWGLVAEGAVPSAVVVVLLPVADHHACLRERIRRDRERRHSIRGVGGGSGCGGWSSENLHGVDSAFRSRQAAAVGAVLAQWATRIASMSALNAALTEIPAADVGHTDAKWTPVRNHFGITAVGVNAYTARNTGDRLIGEHDHADPTDEQHQELYFVHTGHARFQVDGQDVDAPAGTFVSALDVKTIRSAVALSDNTVVLVIGAEPGAPYEVTPAERAELAAAGLPATPA